ncbi:hypothetical protein K1719_010227 [Acacia pycnantha]|nr:hypothetical protein K1719_010227 [Acacia pycnantha]
MAPVAAGESLADLLNFRWLVVDGVGGCGFSVIEEGGRCQWLLASPEKLVASGGCSVIGEGGQCRCLLIRRRRLCTFSLCGLCSGCRSEKSPLVMIN